jgi:hypothetical protein
MYFPKKKTADTRGLYLSEMVRQIPQALGLPLRHCPTIIFPRHTKVAIAQPTVSLPRHILSRRDGKHL